MRKLLFFPLAALLCLTACSNNNAGVKGATATDSSKTEMPAAGSKAERNKQVVLSAMEGMNKHDVAALFANTATGALDYGDGSIKAIPMDSTKTMMSGWFTAFPDYKAADMKITADGEWVMVWSEQSGTWKGELWGQKPTGKTFKVKDVDIFRLNEEGKITEHHNVLSFASAAKQIGFKME